MREVDTSSEVQKDSIKRTRQEYDLGSRKVEVLTVTPEHIKNNPKTGEPVNPVFFEHAYGKEGVQMGEWFAQTMANEGRQVHIVRYMDGKPKDASPVSIDDDAQAAQLDIQKAEDRIALMEKMGIDRADLIAESAGAPRALLEVNQHPDKFGNVILVHPAGMDNRGYVSTHLRVVEHELASLLHPKMVLERGKRWLRRRQIKKEQREERDIPKNRGWSRPEQKAVARAKLHTLIPKVSEAHPNVSFSLIADKNDHNFRRSRLEEVNQGNLFEFVTSDWGSHGIGHRPDRVRQIDALLVRMEKGEKRETQEPRRPKLFQRLLGKPPRR
jgi:pimeloyl-ACP methyl ester carboxylesterase